MTEPVLLTMMNLSVATGVPVRSYEPISFRLVLVRLTSPSTLSCVYWFTASMSMSRVPSINNVLALTSYGPEYVGLTANNAPGSSVNVPSPVPLAPRVLNVPPMMSMSLPLLIRKLLLAVGAMLSVTLTVPLLASPMMIVPVATVTSLSSAVLRRSSSLVELSLANEPRSMAKPLVDCVSVTLPLPDALIVAGEVVVVSKFMLSPITETLPPLAAVVISPELATTTAVPIAPVPSCPVTVTSPPPEVIIEFGAVTEVETVPGPKKGVESLTSTPSLGFADDVKLPPVPFTITAPPPPAAISPLACTATPMLKLLPDPPAVPVTVTPPPLEVMIEFDWVTRTP